MSLEWYKNAEWQMKGKGLKKRVLDLKFSKLDKAAIIATCTICVKAVTNLGEYESKYLAENLLGQQQHLELFTALEPIDCYTELLVREMIVGETAECKIRTSTQNNPHHAVTFVVSLERIEKSRDFHRLKPKEVFDLALRLKENGVKMFKKYPKFAHEYFARAAKCLITFKPFDGLQKHIDDFDSEQANELFIQLQTNLAACLIAGKRYEDVTYLTKFLETTVSDVHEKAIYRRALAYYKLKEYELAEEVIQKHVPDYKERKEFLKLYQQIANDWKLSKNQYKSVVQRMFN